jgi:hypothetical protein
MPYGEIRVDTITFTNAGVDKSITVSGLFASTSGNLTVTGTVSGTTFTGTTANFTSGNVTTFSGGTCTITSGVFASGTATNPSISFIADSNTGFYSPGADQVAIATSGTGRLQINNDGSIGINTGAKLGFGGLSANPGAHYIKYDSGIDGLELNGYGAIAFQTLGTERLRIDSSGRVGIGTSSPASTLEVGGVGKFYTGITGGLGTVALGDNGTTAYNVGIFRGGANSISGGGGNWLNVGGFDGITFTVSNAALGSQTERMRIDSSGRVGIGTTGPVAALHSRTDNAGSGSTPLLIQNRNISSNTAVGISFAPNTSDTADRSAIIYGVNSSGGSGNGTDLTFHTNANGVSPTEKARIDSSGRVGIGTSSPQVLLDCSATGSQEIRISSVTSGDVRFGMSAVGATYNWIDTERSSSAMKFGVGNTERLRIDSSGRLLVGTSTGRNIADAAQGSIQVETVGFGGISITNNLADASGPNLAFGKQRSGSVGGTTIVQNGDGIGAILFGGADGTDLESQGARIEAVVDGTPGANDMPGRLVFSTTADGASSPTERMRITSSGDVRVGSASAYNTEKFTVNNGGGTTSEITAFGGSGGVNHRFYFHNGTAGNAAGTVYWTNTNGTTGRSINAGGTINASGADYAEYMTKAGNFTIAKGEICGVDANAKLTKAFADAVSFLVKSTDPSYVGNDSWGVGYEDDPDGLETERQKVDRIAFAGQVPVNVIGATPGQYIVPIATEEGGIIGIAKDEADLTLAEYMRAVGKVIAIDDDGRARIIVKVA